MKKLITLLTVLFCTLMFGANLASDAQTTGEIAKGNCKSCAENCQKTLDYCNDKKGNLGEASVTNSLKDCVSACKMAADFLNRGTSLQNEAASLAVHACNNAAKTCDKFKEDNAMISCANECRKTIGNCSKLSSKSGGM